MLKAEKWWDDKGAPVMAQAYYLMACAVPSWPIERAAVTLGAFAITFVGVAGFGHVVNDLFDRDADRVAGKANLLDGASPGRIAAWLAATLALAGLPWLVLPATPWTLGLLAGQLTLLVAYAAPPIRLKERPLPGIVSDTLYAYPVPLLITWATFRSPRPWEAAEVTLLATLVVWACSAGARGILTHQVADAQADVAAGITTAVTRRGAGPVARLASRLLPVEVATALAAGTLMSGSAWVTLAVAGAFLGWRTRDIASWGYTWPDRTADRARWIQVIGCLYAGEFYTRWFPVLTLAALVWKAPGLWPIAALHLVVFTSAPVEIAVPRLRRLGVRLSRIAEALRT